MIIIIFYVEDLHRQRALTSGSAISAGSDLPDIDVGDNENVVVDNKKFFQDIFVFKILKLNLPELKWIILGCLSSIMFGAITPVSPHLK